MLKFISFGSGSSGNCYFLFTEKDGLLIDTGVGIRTLKKYYKDNGLSISSIHNIIITHDHADHVKSVGSLSRDYGLSVYATHKVHEGIERNYCVRCKIAPERVKVIEKNTVFHVGEFTVTPFDVPHDSSDNVGYKIQCGDVVFCIMTDVGHVTDEMKHFIGDADYLVIEANHDVEMLTQGPYPEYLKTRILGPSGHLCNHDCAVAVAENATERLKHVWLCHLSEENNHPVLARKTVEQIWRSYGIISGKDFILDVLKRKTPSEVFDLK
jgi:phosphoribosyl 1,2-cyclic phosphodiesterase